MQRGVDTALPCEQAVPEVQMKPEMQYGSSSQLWTGPATGLACP